MCRPRSRNSYDGRADLSSVSRELFSDIIADGYWLQGIGTWFCGKLAVILEAGEAKPLCMKRSELPVICVP